MLRKAQYSRERSDYGDYIVVTVDEVKSQLKDAEELIAEVKRVLVNEIGEF
ncbi:MAG: HEPN domain-containing protein [candidate division KSB1 bacterium]|nr:HEPN domain-containing protein [candidate division KSB1 bacterium]